MSRTRFTAGSKLPAAQLNQALDEVEALAQGGVTLSASSPAMNGTAAPGVAATVSRGDHVHPSDTSRLAAASNLADLGNATTARGNLGLGGAAVLAAAAVAQTTNNLSDLANATTARGNLGLGAAAVGGYGASSPAMDGSASAGAAATLSRSDHVHPSDTSRLAVASNLSDLANATTARGNLGLTAMAILPTAAQGAVVFMGASGPAVLLAGTSGYLLQTNGASANPTWVPPPSGTGGGASVGSATPLMNGTAAAGVAVTASREDHVHPSDTSRLAVANNLSELTASAATVRTNLGLGAVAVLGVSTGLSTSGGNLIVALSNSVPVMDGTAAAGSSANPARFDHVHPSDTSRLAAASNLSDVANAATARSNLGVAAAGATLSFGLGAVVANGSIPVDIPYGYTLTSMVTNVGTAGGSFAVTVSIGGTPVTGLNAIAVSSSTDSTATATAANTGAAGQVLVTIASTTGSPTDSKIILRWTR